MSLTHIDPSALYRAKGGGPDENQITQQVVAQIKKGPIPGENVILQQVAAQIGEDGIFKENEIATQLVPQIVSVPWGHIILIMNHAGQDRKKALFYITQTVLDNWPRAMLLNFIESDLYARQGKAVTNFDRSLPEEGSGRRREPRTRSFLLVAWQGHRPDEGRNKVGEKILSLAFKRPQSAIPRRKRVLRNKLEYMGQF